jgi:hypothetical protein
MKFQRLKLTYERILNGINKDEISVLFGVGSKLVVESLEYSQTNKKFIAHIKVITTNINEGVEAYTSGGIEVLAENAWKFLSIRSGLIVVGGIDVVTT